MILEIIFGCIFAVVLLFLKLIPSMPKVDGIVSLISPLFDVAYKLNYFVDLKVLAICLLIIIAVLNVRLIGSIIMFVIRKIPGVS